MKSERQLLSMHGKLRNRRKTLVGPERFLNACRSVEYVIEKGIEGSIIECGIYKGGCFGAMVKIAKSAKTSPSKKCFGFDTFAGHPDYAPKKRKSKRAVSVKDVRKFLKNEFDLSTSDYTLVKGLVEEEIPKIKEEIGKVAVLRLDVDWYKPTLSILQELYDNVSPGGIIIIDDYGHYKECRKAVNEFFYEIDPTFPNRTEKMMVDYTCLSMTKELQPSPDILATVV